jgi:LCP family protein required for cell wall assembly
VHPRDCLTTDGTVADAQPSEGGCRAITGRLIDRPASPCRHVGTRARRVDSAGRHHDQSGHPWSTTAIAHAHPIRPDRRQIRPNRRPTDQRRLLAAILSGVVPGLGQAVNGRARLAALFVVPSLILLLLAALIISTTSTTMLLARAIVPDTLRTLLFLDVVVLVWRLAAVVHAFGDRRYPRRPGRIGVIGLAIVVILVALPHALAGVYGSNAFTTFEKVFAGSQGTAVGGPNDDPGSTAGPTPQTGERINVLLLGIDSGPSRTQALTDTIMVVSLDPVGRTVTMLSIPRDLVDVPLGHGSAFAPKINSLLGWANRHKADFPQGGTRALEDAIGALLGIPIHYYAKVDLGGFVAMVDAVGGVDIKVAKRLSDPNYGGFGVGPGWSIEPGTRHLNGANALAYARIRKSAGESDFTRAARQQQVLVALRNRAVKNGLLGSLPTLLQAVGDTVRTDLPASRLPEFAAFAEEIGGDRTTQQVLTSPMVKSGGANNPYGSVVVPVPMRIRQLVATIFPPPGTPPGPWPPKATPRPSATP